MLRGVSCHAGCRDRRGLQRHAGLVEVMPTNVIAKWMIERGYATGHGDNIEDMLAELEWQAKERGIREANSKQHPFLALTAAVSGCYLCHNPTRPLR